MVECFQTRKGYHLGIENVFQEWYWDGKGWVVLTKDIKDSEWFCEEYNYGKTDTAKLLENWLTYLPGVIEWDSYGEFSVSFDMDEVAEAGWDEEKLVCVLERMADKVNRGEAVRILAEDAPWMYDTHDAWGAPHRYYRYPALRPLPGMLDKDYPAEMEAL